MSKKRIRYNWDETGTLDIRVDGNQNATLRYRPSSQFVQETLAKFSKTAGNGSKTEIHKLTPPNTKSSQNGSKSPTIDICDRIAYSSRIQRSSFADLSREVRYNMRKGNWVSLVKNYEQMAEILHLERKHYDELKCLLLAFHIRLSGAGETAVADDSLVGKSKEAAKLAKMSLGCVVDLYKSEIDSHITPTHLYSVDEACRIYCTIWQGIW